MDSSTTKRRKTSSNSFTPISGRDPSVKLRSVTVQTPKDGIAVSPAKTNSIKFFSVSYEPKLRSPKNQNTSNRASPSLSAATTQTTKSPGQAASTIQHTLQPTAFGDASDQHFRASSPDAGPLTGNVAHNLRPRTTADSADVLATLDSQGPAAPPGQLPSTPSPRKPAHPNDGEPSLPSTPSQLGVEPPSAPPSGLKTNAKRLKMSYRSSPLKSKAEITAGSPASSSIPGPDSPSARALNGSGPEGSAAGKISLR
ncbi:MAG: hypothetical protein Q9218_004133 [Villophora microphyllina]